MLKRFTTDFEVVSLEKTGEDFILLTLKHPEKLPEICAGQFVEVKIPDTAGTFLRRPISIHDVDYSTNTLTLLVKIVGNGTRKISQLSSGSIVNLVYPLGNGFPVDKWGNKPLLIGGGVGVAPLLYLAKEINRNGGKAEFLFGARNAQGVLREEVYSAYGKVNITTEDGSMGIRGFVTDHECLTTNAKNYSSFLVCGPTPMMKAVSKVAKAHNIPCYVSLENKMACGIGVCLCCVTDTVQGHKCVCSEGPVFEINDLKWE